jgi:beta-glucosidase
MNLLDNAVRAACWIFLVLWVLLIGASTTQAQWISDAEARVRTEKLLYQMTLEEKINLIRGAGENPATYQGQGGYLAGVPRLRVPGLRFADGPPGVLTRVAAQCETATLGVAATFSVKDAEENGLIIGRQDRAMGIDVSLQPFVNMARDLVFARAYNTFGEDPFLTSQIGAAEIKSIQSQHVMAMVKHYVAYDSQSLNIFVDDQTLHEIYVVPFAAAVHAGVASIMCSYNHVNGPYSCGNKDTLTGILRDQLRFKGFVTSDWPATHTAEDINAGLDMEMPGNTGEARSFFSLKPLPVPHRAEERPNYKNHIPEDSDGTDKNGGKGFEPEPETMPEALKDGTVTEATIDRAAGRVLYEIIRFGYMDGMQKHTVTPQDIDANAKAIEKTGEDAAVLLKNEGNILPLRISDLSSVALIGPTAGQVDAIGKSGEHAVGLFSREVSPLAALKRISGNPNIAFAVADDMTGKLVPVDVLSYDGKPGLLRTGPCGMQTDAQLNFTVKGGNALPPNSTCTWKGALTISRTGSYWLYLQALGVDASIYVDGSNVGATSAVQGDHHGDVLQPNQDNIVPTTDGLDNVRRAVELSAGPHTIEINIRPDTSDAAAQIRLNWYTPEQRETDYAAAIAVARKARIAVVFAWERPEADPVFALPGDQDKLINEIAAVNPNTIVVLNTSEPVAMPWVDKVRAILEMWFPGDEGGWSTANVLLGKVSPAGRLPITMGRRLEDYPATDPRYPERSFKGVDGKTIYSEGVNIGYRWFDKEKIDPLYPFGFGLSYTSFAYSSLKIAKSSDGGLDVSVNIRNVGKMASDEVPQVYLGGPQKILRGVQFPVRALAAFDRVHILAGESKTVTLHVPPRQLQYWSTADGKWVGVAGKRTVSVGSSSRDLRLEQTID